MKSPLFALPAFAVIAALIPAVVLAQTPPRPEDQARLDQFDAALGSALRQALVLPASDPSRVAALAALSGRAIAARPDDLAGDWACRTIKLGKTTPATAYGAFRCRITVSGGVAVLEKLSGSQRLRGEIAAAPGGQMVLTGTGYIAGDTPPAYADLPARTDPSATPQRVPVVGLVEMTGPTRARIMMPLPWLESAFDLLELTR